LAAAASPIKCMSALFALILYRQFVICDPSALDVWCCSVFWILVLFHLHVHLVSQLSHQTSQPHIYTKTSCEVRCDVGVGALYDTSWCCSMGINKH
jgi:hypothetical protein